MYTVEFEVAVTVEEGANAKAGIKVLGMSVGGGLEGMTASTNRIKFSVPIEYPRKP